MRTTTTLSLCAIAISGLVFAACGDDTGTGGAAAASGSTVAASSTHSVSVASGSSTKASSGAGPTSGSTSTGGGFPVAPAIGDQIDRMGRPAINTALNQTFLDVTTTPPSLSTDAARAAAEDDYNANDDPATWAATYTPTFAAQLAALDSLDSGTANGNDGCSNQLLAGDHDDPNAYNALAGALTGDFLWVKTGATTCGAYLGVEASVLISPNDDCGGRRQSDDVIKTSYSALISGTLTTVDDGITHPDNASQATFPYYAPPHS